MTQQMIPSIAAEDIISIVASVIIATAFILILRSYAKSYPP